MKNASPVDTGEGACATYACLMYLNVAQPPSAVLRNASNCNYGGSGRENPNV